MRRTAHRRRATAARSRWRSRSPGFLAISFLGVRDLDITAAVDAESALSSGAVAGFVAVVYAAATTGGEIAAAASRSRCSRDPDRTQAVRRPARRPRAAGAMLGAAGAVTAAIADVALLGAGGGPFPGADEVLARAPAGRSLYALADGRARRRAGPRAALAGRGGHHRCWSSCSRSTRCSPASCDAVAQWGPGGAAGALTGSGAEDLPPAWAGGLALVVYAGLLGAAAAALTARRDVP